MLTGSTHALAALPLAGGHVSTLGVLAAFVAINTVMYLGLAVIKMVPRVRLGRRFRRGYERAETRSIHPGLGWIAHQGERVP